MQIRFDWSKIYDDLVSQSARPQKSAFAAAWQLENDIFAEGAPAESFIDDGSRDQFDNAAEYWQRYPKTVRTAPGFCAARVEEGFELDAVRRRLDRIAMTATTAPEGAVFPLLRPRAGSTSGSVTGLV